MLRSGTDTEDQLLRFMISKGVENKKYTTYSGPSRLASRQHRKAAD
jgi:hypothetical protein